MNTAGEFAAGLTRRNSFGRVCCFALLAVVLPRSSHLIGQVSSVPRKREIAGVRLSRYPHFAYVDAFNRDESVEAAVDPATLPRLAGKEVDLYVVNHRSTSQWSSDPSLADVRSSGPQRVTVREGTVRDNTFTVATAGQLAGNPGTALGAGYDLIVDADRDGVLGGNDVIDGLAGKPGFVMVTNLGEPGPLPVTMTDYTVERVMVGYEQARVCRPATIADLGRLPLVVVSHGHHHHYTWYDYLLRRLASYGFIVMSHANSTMTGPEASSQTILQHIDELFRLRERIDGGVLAGHIDSTRVALIGHSRGGEGVVLAYMRMADRDWVSRYVTPAGIRIISSIAPTRQMVGDRFSGYDVNYHLLYGAADGDVQGEPGRGSLPFALFETAGGCRQSTYIHGADHGDFNSGPYNDFEGPPETEIGTREAQGVAASILTALMKLYLEGDAAGVEYFRRQNEQFSIPGVSGQTVVVKEYRSGPDVERFIIDDFQDGDGDPARSSSGGGVSYTVENLTEGPLHDRNGSFDEIDPMNGMSRSPLGLSRGASLSWDTDAHLDFDIIDGARDFTRYEFLSLRAAQISRHPLTVAEAGDLVFTVAVRDNSGLESSIRIDAYGGGIEEPYARGGGWQCEFETVTIRLTDFLRNGRDVDLTDIAGVKLAFGPSHGSSVGALALDDLMLHGDIPDRKGPWIECVSWEIGDEDSGERDGVLNPGETVDLWASFRNSGLRRGREVRVTLTGEDRFVTVLDSVVTLGAMPNDGVTRSAPGPLKLHLAADCPTPRDIAVKLSFSDRGEPVRDQRIRLRARSPGGLSRVSGMVTWKGSPVLDATVGFDGPLSDSVTTLSDGSYVFGGPDGTFSVTASKKGLFASDPVSVTLPPDRPAVDFALSAPEIEVDPEQIVVKAHTPSPSAQQITIRNTGNVPLTWTMADHEPEQAGVLIDSFSLKETVGTPDGVAFDGANLWVSKRRRALVYRLDPSSGSVRGTLELSRHFERINELAWDGYRLLVAVPGADVSVAAVNPSNGAVEQTWHVGPEGTGVAVGGGAVWIMAGQVVYKMSPTSNEVHDSVRLPDVSPAYLFGIAWLDGSLFAAAYHGSYLEAKIFEIDPVSGVVVSTFQSPDRRIRGIAASEEDRSIWCVDKSSDAAFRVKSGENLWLNHDQRSGTVGPGTSVSVRIDFNGQSPGPGVYPGLSLRSNDPDNPRIDIPVVADIATHVREGERGRDFARNSGGSPDGADAVSARSSDRVHTESVSPPRDHEPQSGQSAEPAGRGARPRFSRGVVPAGSGTADAGKQRVIRSGATGAGKVDKGEAVALTDNPALGRASSPSAPPGARKDMTAAAGGGDGSEPALSPRRSGLPDEGSAAVASAGGSEPDSMPPDSGVKEASAVDRQPVIPEERTRAREKRGSGLNIGLVVGGMALFFLAVFSQSG